MTEAKTRKCRKCGKEKTAQEGYVQLGGLFFCCKECCKRAEGGKKGGEKPNVCEFC